MPGTCDPSTIEENEERAKATGVPYCPVSMTITQSSSTKISFLALDKNHKPTEYKDIAWNKDMWIKCPSTLSASADQPPAVGEAGVLYLAKPLIEKLNLLGTPKWPTALSTVVPTTQLRVWPTKVVVHGHQLHDGTLSFGSVDLLNPRHALTVQTADPKADKPPQHLVLDGGAVTLSLTDAGLNECFRVSTPIESLRGAVGVILESADARQIASALQTIATWIDVSATAAELRSAEARSLVRQVLPRFEL